MKKQFLAGAVGLFLLLGYQSAQAADVVSFTLVDAISDTVISAYDPIAPGATINLNPGQKVTVRANLNGTVGSVRMSYGGPNSGSQTESVAPYSLLGDSNGNYTPWSPTLGSVYSITGQSFTGTGGGGTPGTAYSINVTFVEVAGANGSGAVQISASPKQWHAVTLTLDGPWASETGTPNPFLDYRMQVTFSNGVKTYSVPGYFAADGLGAESNATSGSKWRAHLCPDTAGVWTYTISFTSGANVAVASGGTVMPAYNGLNDDFTVAPTDKDPAGPDFRGKGRLEVVNGERYLRFVGSEDYFIKVGPDSPERLLAFTDFDGTSKHYTASTTSPGVEPKDWQLLPTTRTDHVDDWQTGDPTWKGGKGKGLIGALNYLALKKMNTISFLTYNAGGDGKDVWPFVAYTEKVRYDVSKLAQWDVVFDHADKKGIHLHFKTQEQENDNDATFSLDAGAVLNQRKLYYRELIARFSHHLGLTWNLGEENQQTTSQVQQMAQYFYDNDPYRHLVVLHTFPAEHSRYTPLLGSLSKLTGASIQTPWNQVHKNVLKWVNDSTDAGKAWIVTNDEQGPADHGIPFDSYIVPSGMPSQAQVRGSTLWGSLMAGGAGVESYFGYDLIDPAQDPDEKLGDLENENFRPWSNWWDYCHRAAEFFRLHLPFEEMANANDLVGNTVDDNSIYCFAKTGEVYCLYLPNGGSPWLDLSGETGSFSVHWYNPRTGGALQPGPVQNVTGGGTVQLGLPPSETTSDWVALVRSGVAPPASTNQAIGKVATASTSQSGNGAGNANDNSTSSRWAASSVAYPQWWKVDLGASKTLTAVESLWYVSSTRGYQYRIEVSPNDVTYTEVVNQSANATPGIKMDAFSATGRYVRITVLGCTVSTGWAGAHEFRVFGY
jgi:hypothetical protein